MTMSVQTDAAFDVETVRRDFPILATSVGDKPLVYLDNAATAQKPQAVIDALTQFYAHHNANVHRGLHHLSEKATVAYEQSRETARRFLNASSTDEIIFVRGTTEAINLVAQSFGRPRLTAGDEVVITGMEHHSNIVPWQLMCEQTGAALRVVPVDDRGALDLDAYEKLLSSRTKLVSIAHVSNALGTVNPVQQVIRSAHAQGAVVMLDGAQAAPHQAIDVQDLDADFYAFSGHKVFGPTGIGVLFGRKSLLADMPPYHGGGEMIRSVTFEKTTYKPPPARFEAGTPNIAGAVGLAAALQYVADIGHDRIAAYETDLLQYVTEQMSAIEGLRIIGTAPEKAAVISFTLDNAHPHDIATILDTQGIAVRAGHHCAQPLMKRFGVPATARASLAFYNTKAEIDALVQAIVKVREMFH